MTCLFAVKSCDYPESSSSLLPLILSFSPHTLILSYSHSLILPSSYPHLHLPLILPSSHHDRIPPRAQGNVNANAALGNGIGFGLKLGLTAAMTRSRVAIIADNVRREKEDEKSMLDILFKEDRMDGR